MALSIDPDYLRDGLARWRRTSAESIPAQVAS